MLLELFNRVVVEACSFELAHDVLVLLDLVPVYHGLDGVAGPFFRGCLRVQQTDVAVG